MKLTTGDQIVDVNVADRATLWAHVRDRIASGRGFALATVNLDHLVKLRDDAAFARAYAEQDFVVADGRPIVWLSRLAGDPVALMPGSDLVVPLCELAAREGWPVALVGSTEETLARAAQALHSRVPGLKVAHLDAPPMGFDPDGAAGDAALDRLAAADARLCFLALGAPKQERLAARGITRAPQMGFASVGAGLDFLAGTQRRAPRLVRALALEWLWRALSNPRRLGPRYVRCAAILPDLVWRALRQRAR